MLLLLTTLLIFSYFFHLLYWKRRKLPPGPTPLPLIGTVYCLSQKLKPGYKVWRKMTDKYGPVYTFWMGHLPVVMVTDYQLIKQSFIKDGNSYTGRPQIPLITQIKQGTYGIIDTWGDRWVQQRRFALHVLRNFGMGKNLMEEKVIGELQSLVENVKKEQSENGKVDMQDSLDVAVGSIINNILFGYRYDETNMKEFLELKEIIMKQINLAASPFGGFIMLYPWIGKFPIFSKYYKLIAGNLESLMDLFRGQIAEKLKTIDYDNEEYSDYVEAFLKEKKKHENEPNYGGYELEQLNSVCFDLWLAGMETTSNTLYWALLYVLVNDNVKQKIYKELDSKIENDRIITSSDRSELNYINATINEVQRLANIVPTNLNHRTTKDVEIGGHTIPEGTIITAQISQVLYNEEIFPEPYKFEPERFLDSEGNLLKIEEFIPFSIGKRQCLGEGLAKLELFIFFANIFNQFDITLDSSNPSPSLGKHYGITMKPENFKLQMKSRF